MCQFEYLFLLFYMTIYLLCSNISVWDLLTSSYMLLFLQITGTPYNSHVGGATGADVSGSSHVLTVNFKEGNGETYPMKDMAEPAKLVLKRDITKQSAPMETQGGTIQDNPNSFLAITTYNMTRKGNAFMYQIKVTVKYNINVHYHACTMRSY